MDSPDNRLSCSISLYSSRTEHDLKPWISSQGNIDNILYSRTDETKSKLKHSKGWRKAA